ncbi:MAG TPA: TlpA family protein disulfide reductase, partial [Nannocystis exedens]|nr:TlpA family protein disulfide reductase [Nannocystis exedens]
MAHDEAQPLIHSALFCLMLAGVSILFSLLIWRRIRRIEKEIARIQEVAASCRGPRLAPHTGSHRPPPQDRVQRERPYLGNEGVDISPAMQVRLEYLDESSELRSARVGDPRLLLPSTIHIVNLWAVWCGACKEEMPDFQRLFAENSSIWKDDVRFVAVQVNDLSAPKHAYESWASSMPAKTLRLSDRGQGAPFLEALRGTQSTQPLYFDKLPVTLVLDCNRRVRWAKFERLVDGDLQDLERHVERLRTELLEVGPNARCNQIWCGNGRCEEGEGVAENRCEEDCGDFIARRSPAAEVLPLPAVDPSVL